MLQILPDAYQAFAKMVALAGVAELAYHIAYAKLATLEEHVTVTTPIWLFLYRNYNNVSIFFYNGEIHYQ